MAVPCMQETRWKQGIWLGRFCNGSGHASKSVVGILQRSTSGIIKWSICSSATVYFQGTYDWQHSPTFPRTLAFKGMEKLTRARTEPRTHFESLGPFRQRGHRGTAQRKLVDSCYRFSNPPCAIDLSKEHQDRLMRFSTYKALCLSHGSTVTR